MSILFNGSLNGKAGHLAALRSRTVGRSRFLRSSRASAVAAMATIAFAGCGKFSPNATLGDGPSASAPSPSSASESARSRRQCTDLISETKPLMLAQFQSLSDMRAPGLDEAAEQVEFCSRIHRLHLKAELAVQFYEDVVLGRSDCSENASVAAMGEAPFLYAAVAREIAIGSQNIATVACVKTVASPQERSESRALVAGHLEKLTRDLEQARGALAKMQEGATRAESL